MEHSWRWHSALSRKILELPGLSSRQETQASRGPNVPEADGAACGIVLPLLPGIACDTQQFLRTRRRAIACRVFRSLAGNVRTPLRARRISCLLASRNCVWRGQLRLHPEVLRG